MRHGKGIWAQVSAFFASTRSFEALSRLAAAELLVHRTSANSRCFDQARRALCTSTLLLSRAYNMMWTATVPRRCLERVISRHTVQLALPADVAEAPAEEMERVQVRGLSCLVTAGES
jgi:hypothetical protein